MSKWLTATTLVLAVQTQVHGWGRADELDSTNDESKSYPLGFYHQDDRMMFIKADYLFWLPHQEDLFYAVKVASSNATTSKATFKQPNFDLSSGVRFGIGGYTDDRWDVGLRATYLFSDADNKTHRPSGSSSTNFVIPSWDETLISTVAKAKSNWKLNFILLDYVMGREYSLTTRFALHPFIGLRNCWIYQKYDTRFASLYQNTVSNGLVSNVFTLSANTSFKAQNDIWGIGPRVGTDFTFYLNENWAFLGGLSGSLLYSRYNTHQKFNGFQFTGNTVNLTGSYTPSSIRTRDNHFLLRTNLDAYFGLGVEHWFNRNKNRVYVSLLFEASEWFGMNQLNDLNTFFSNKTQEAGAIADIRRHGDLGFIGGTLHFQMDF